MQNHFELFGLPQCFAIDEAALNVAYRALQNQVHPDKFVSAGAAEKRVALQWATQANEAYQTLIDPLKRAAYLCALQGIDVQSNSNTAMAPAFFMQQMEWREALDEARLDEAVLDDLHQQVRKTSKQCLQRIAQLLDDDQTNQVEASHAAAEQVRQLMFLEKFDAEVAHALDILQDAAATSPTTPNPKHTF